MAEIQRLVKNGNGSITFIVEGTLPDPSTLSPESGKVLSSYLLDIPTVDKDIQYFIEVGIVAIEGCFQPIIKHGDHFNPGIELITDGLAFQLSITLEPSLASQVELSDNAMVYNKDMNRD